MRVALVIICISVCAFAQEKTRFGQPTVPPASVTAACGNLDVSMAVKLDDAQHAIAQPESKEALVYFIQDTGLSTTIAYPTTKIGIDGTWVGANKKDSYFAVFVAPGEHHLCVAIQSSIVRNNIELAHFTAEAGKVYFYRTRIIASRDGLDYLGFLAVDSDQAAYLIASDPLATAHSRK